MLYSGLVSVTFRRLEPSEIIRLVKNAGLDGIEWGGDIHVPHGDTARAAEIFKMTEDSGLKIGAYGSYYRVGCDTNNKPFNAVLETAVALHAPVIRVWAGDRASAEADEAYWKKVVSETRQIAELSAQEGINVSFEYHPNTLTDTPESEQRLMKEINHHNARCYWQPEAGGEVEFWLASLRSIIPWLTNVHVNCGAAELETMYGTWTRYFDIIKNLEGNRYCMIEFVKGGTEEQFLKDARVLKKLLQT